MRGHSSQYAGSLRIFSNYHKYGFSEQSIVEFCHSFSTYGEMIEQFAQSHCEKARATYWLEKTPANIFNFPHLMTRFPKARFIQIVRDGRDATTSFVKRHAHPLYALARWYCSTLAGQHLIGNDRFLRVRYEDLVRNPIETLTAVCNFVGVQFDERTIDPQRNEFDSLPSWSSSPHSKISKASIGTHLKNDSPALDWTWHHIQLTPYGQNLCSHANSPISPLELQQTLGYSTNNIDEPPSISAAEKSRMARHIFKWHRDMLCLYKSPTQSPVTLDIWKTSPSGFLIDCFNPRTLSVPLRNRILSYPRQHGA